MTAIFDFCVVSVSRSEIFTVAIHSQCYGWPTALDLGAYIFSGAERKAKLFEESFYMNCLNLHENARSYHLETISLHTSLLYTAADFERSRVPHLL